MKQRGFPILGILFLIFLTLKLAEVGAVVAWSWWAVTAPLWVPFAVVAVFFGIGGLCIAIAALATKLTK